MNDTLVVCEIFKSIQGESTYTGLPCIFIRLTGCNLSCTYCDTEYAKAEGKEMSIQEILSVVDTFSGDLVEVTGGEPLFQEATPLLIEQLISRGKKVLLETNGSYSIREIPVECINILDVKCPSSGMSDHFFNDNLSALKKSDELKFVIGTPEDFSWAHKFITANNLGGKAHLLLSPVTGFVAPKDLAQWILESNAPVRMQLQQHKLIWGDKRGV